MDDLNGVFTISDNGKLVTYNRLGDVPDTFDFLIKYEPTIPEPPHNQEQHDAMELYPTYLANLLTREKGKQGYLSNLR
tara:strand:- start:66 stop:299 length:234 start_codon:yes stop_codon:yes gene_type:complete